MPFYVDIRNIIDERFGIVNKGLASLINTFFNFLYPSNFVCSMRGLQIGILGYAVHPILICRF